MEFAGQGGRGKIISLLYCVGGNGGITTKICSAKDAVLMLISRPKGQKNQFKYYPERYIQYSEHSIIDENRKYDMSRYSSEELSIIKKAISASKGKYPTGYRALGLVNEADCTMYKPRYILFDMAAILYDGSESALDRIAASFAYANKGAAYRRRAIELFEGATNQVHFWELDKCSGTNSAVFYYKMAELYKREHNFSQAIYLLRLVVLRGGLYNRYIREKIKALEESVSRGKDGAPVRRKAKVDSFDREVRAAAMFFIESEWRKD